MAQPRLLATAVVHSAEPRVAANRVRVPTARECSSATPNQTATDPLAARNNPYIEKDRYKSVPPCCPLGPCSRSSGAQAPRRGPASPRRRVGATEKRTAPRAHSPRGARQKGPYIRFSCQRTSPGANFRSPAAFFPSRAGISSSGQRSWFPGRLPCLDHRFSGFPGAFFHSRPLIQRSRAAILRSGAPSLFRELNPALKSVRQGRLPYLISGTPSTLACA